MLRSAAAAVSAVSPRCRPAGSSWASSACCCLMVWVRARTRSRCSVGARRAAMASSMTAVWRRAAVPPDRASAGSDLRPCQSRAAGRGGPVSRARRPRRRRRWPAWPSVRRPGRSRLRSPRLGGTSGWRTAHLPVAVALTLTRITARGCRRLSTATAVRDALWGSIAMTTGARSGDEAEGTGFSSRDRE